MSFVAGVSDVVSIESSAVDSLNWLKVRLYF